MRRRNLSILVLSALLACGCFALAPAARAAEAAAGPETPEAFAERFAAATQSGDWAASAALMHPQALETFKGMFSDMADLDGLEEVLEPMFGVSSAEEFQQMSGGQVFVRVMQSLEKLVPGFAEALAESSMDVVGSVAEGDDVVHVVYKMQMSVEDVGVSRTSVVSLRRDGEQWRALLTGNVEGMARSLADAMWASPVLPPGLDDDEGEPGSAVEAADGAS